MSHSTTLSTRRSWMSTWRSIARNPALPRTKCINGHTSQIRHQHRHLSRPGLDTAIINREATNLGTLPTPIQPHLTPHICQRDYLPSDIRLCRSTYLPTVACQKAKFSITPMCTKKQQDTTKGESQRAPEQPKKRDSGSQKTTQGAGRNSCGIKKRKGGVGRKCEKKYCGG